MDKLYKFSPIKNEKELMFAIEYVVKQTSYLCMEVIGDTLPIKYLTIFSHYEEEYEQLISICKKLGSISKTNNGMKFRLNNYLSINGQQIKQLRIRKPDPYRTQVGCCDFIVDNYEEFKKEFLDSNQNLRLIEKEEYEMIEFFHPNYDVLSYLVS